MEKQQQFQRLQSLDALRGFDMFFIMGGESLFVALGVLFPNVFFRSIAAQMHHVPWDGFACYDMIFPLFLFIAGISFPFSLSKQLQRKTNVRTIYTHIIRRGLTLVLLGILYNGLLEVGFANARYASVLGRIGLAWMFAAMIYMNTRTLSRVLVTGGILVGYWLLLILVAAPDANGASPLSMQGSLVGYIDRLLLPGRLHSGIHDPEGLLSTVPAISTALLGMLTGEYIKSDKIGLTPIRKVVYLLVAGLLLVGIGHVWGSVFPLNKNLWSSSFVCFVGGLSVILFALFYYVIDVCNFRKWTFFFTVIGMNSITIYLAQRVIDFNYTSAFFFNGITSLVPENMQWLVSSVGYLIVSWLFLYFLYRKRIFLKV